MTGEAGASGADPIVFEAALNLATTPVTTVLANKGLSSAVASTTAPAPRAP